MRIDAETGELVIHQIDVDHILGWFIDGDNLQEAIERELILHGLEEEWDFNINKIVFDDTDLNPKPSLNPIIEFINFQFQRYP